MSFLIAGVQKSGTTTLWEQVRRLPGLFLPERKELHFFDNETLDWTAPDLNAYHRAFAPAPAGALWGEATPIYLFWPQALERIRAYSPAMRLILVFRDPIERAVSHWRMSTARQIETRPLAMALRAEADWPGSRLAAEQRQRDLSYVQRGLYGQQLARALSLFPREQMLLLTSDEVWRDAARAMAQVARFLGVEPPKAVSPIRAFAASGPDVGLTPADIAFLRDRLTPDLARFAALSGLDLSGWLTLGGRTVPSRLARPRDPDQWRLPLAPYRENHRPHAQRP